MGLYRAMSLPSNADFARSEYGKYLRDMLTKNGFGEPVPTVTVAAADDKDQNKKLLPGAAKKEPPFQKVNVRVVAEGKLENVDKVLEEFYRTPLLHQIHDLTLERPLTPSGPGREREVKLIMTIEALIVTGAEKRNYLMREVDPNLLAIDTVAALRREPTGFALALDAISPASPVNGPYRLNGVQRLQRDRWSRLPRSIALKNVFYGKPPDEAHWGYQGPRPTGDKPDGTPQLMATRFVRLNHFFSGARLEMNLYDVSTDHLYKLRATSPFNTFPFIKDGSLRPVVLGTVVKIDDELRDLYFRVELSAADPPGSDPYYFYKLDKKDLDKLVSDKVITKEQAPRTLRVSQVYWDSLVRTEVIKPTKEKDTFHIELRPDGSRTATQDGPPPTEILKGKIVKSNEDELLIVTEERFYQILLG